MCESSAVVVGSSTKTALVRLVCFPWAGGSSLLFSAWVHHEELSRIATVHALDFPGRMRRINEPPVKDLSELVDKIIEEEFGFSSGQEGEMPFALFGHSFGAIVAFEVALRLESMGRKPVAIFLSASVAPHVSPIVKTAVSQLPVSDLIKYFSEKGNALDPMLLAEPSALELFLRNVRADYTCLETYAQTYATLECPTYVIGGGRDPGVSIEELQKWKTHSSGAVFSCKVYDEQGHYYLNHAETFKDIGAYVGSALMEHAPKASNDNLHKEEVSSPSEVQALESLIAEIFRNVLGLEFSIDIGSKSNFFELGGTSLDTMLLTTQLKAALNLHITQNEFIMCPTVKLLALRIAELQQQSSGVPVLEPIGSQSQEWFPASAGQEQMVSCWESAPTMYNIPTTIEFHGNLDVNMLRQSFISVVQRQSSLRTIIRIDHGTNHVYQKVLDDPEECLEFSIVVARNEEDARLIIEKESVYSFDLTCPPVVRGTLVRNDNGAKSSSYLFLLNQHHVGSDGWSRTQLRQQLLKNYLDIKNGNKLEPAKEHPSYIDWTMWSRKWLNEYGQKEKQIKYWKKKLHGLPALDLPLDYPRPAVLSSRGARIPVKIDAEMTERFSAMMIRNEVNLFVGLLSLYMALLHRWGAGDDFAIGIALANRHHEGLEDRIGYFANEVAIRTDFSSTSLCFLELLHLVRQNVLEGMANADAPFHQVTEALKVTRDRSRTSTFQAMFALQEREWHSLDSLNQEDGDLSFNLKTFNHHTSKFEVHLQLRYDGEGGLEGDFHVATDLFTKKTGERLVEAFKILMKHVVEAPTAALNTHDILPMYDQQLSVKCNATKVAYGETSVLEMISSVDREAIAVLGDGGLTHTFGDLCDNAVRVASYLRESLMVERQECIGVLMQSSCSTLSAILGISMAECTNVIIDLEKTPAERCEMILEDAGVKKVVVETHNTRFEALSSCGFRVVPWKEMQHSAVREECPLGTASMTPFGQLDKEDIFGIFYTSGTTGKPKGAVITIGNINNLVHWWVDFFSLGQNDRVLLFSSLSFIMSIRQWIPTLCAGAAVVVPKSSFGFEAAIVENNVTKLVCTPSALAALDVNMNHSINTIQVAGEPPQLQTLLSWSGVVKDVYIGLGPTELCAHGLCGRFDGHTLCIGHPAQNVRAYIVDPKTGLQVPINSIGELWVAGENVAKGYLNRPELTSSVFMTDPFAKNGDRLYKTGDLARRLFDGRIQFVGRRDKQLKVNGFRIEPGEIINAMPSHVKRAHILLQDGNLTAFVAPEVDKEQIVSVLEKKLPTYMIPSLIVTLPDFPLNKNKKIDVAELLKQSTEALKKCLSKWKLGADDFSGLESLVRLVWAEILSMDVLSIQKEDNFFESGGTSLSAVIMSRKLSSELGTEISVQDIFEHQSIAAFASSIEKSNEMIHKSNAPPLIFLSGGRKRMQPLAFGVLQAVGLVLMSFLVVVPSLITTFISIRAFIWFGNVGFLLFPPFLIMGCLFHMSLVLLCKWLIIGRYRPGKAQVYSWMFLKWWLVRRIVHMTRLYTWIFDQTSFSRLWMVLLGAKIGKRVHIEQPYLLEPDLVTIGDDSVLEFEVQFSTAEIRDGLLELRPVSVGSRVKVGVRAVLLGGATVHDGCEIRSKSVVDFYCTSTNPNQCLCGSPSHVIGETNGETWCIERGHIFALLQLVGCVLQIYLMAGIVFVGVELGLLIEEKFGTIVMIAYLGSVFSVLSSFIFLTAVAVLKHLLIHRIEPNRLYGGSWFALRKWFLDRLFLSPLFRYASERTLQTSSTFPWYLRLLGAKVGSKAWMNHPYIRVGVEHIHVGDDSHMGMLSYFSTEQSRKDGISFSPITIGNHTSFGQRCVVLAGSKLEDSCTVGAETIIPQDFHLAKGGTTFGSSPVKFISSASYDTIVDQGQQGASLMLEARKEGCKSSMTEIFTNDSVRDDDWSEDQVGSSSSSDFAPQRRQDVGKNMFWTYVVVMLTMQAMVPLVIGGSYGAIYFLITVWIGEIQLALAIFVVPLIYLLGSAVLMGAMKLMQSFGGSFSIGTANFFSWRFFYWHMLADLIYLATSTIIYPFSGTQFYCMWLRFMRAKVGKRAFVSPENGGFREVDFLDIGDDCVLMTPNIHAHYTDHGMLQFCPVKLENGVEVNPGATIMPLTQYAENSRLRPFSVTLKGQQCERQTEYFGNPCKQVKITRCEGVAVLFPGQGSQYPGMLDAYLHISRVKEMVETASKVLGYDVASACSNRADSKQMQNTSFAQPLLFVTSLAAAEAMRQTHPLDFSKVIACAGFSLGELTALCFSGAISFHDALRLVVTRAEAMAACNGGAMCNVRGLPRKLVANFCKKAGCTIANIICDHQAPELSQQNIFVCAGSVKSVDLLIDFVTKNSHGRAKKLRVSGAFHTKHMKPAQKALQIALQGVPITLPSKHLVYSNVTGLPYQSKEDIRSLLVEQIVRPVEWHAAIEDMKLEGVDKFIECGPMDILSKTIRGIDPESPDRMVLNSEASIGLLGQKRFVADR